MRLLKQSTARNLTVLMVDSGDHVTGKTGLTLTITASKNGGAFGAITPTVTELATGWYKLELTTAHTDTVGDLSIHVTGTGADPSDIQMQVYANDFDALATPTNITGGTITTVTNLTNLPAITTDWLTAAGVKADAVTKIQTGLALEATLTAIKGAGWSTETLAAIDVLIDAIKAKTDLIPAVPAEVGSAMTLTAAYDKAKDDVLTPLAVVDGIADAIKLQTDLIPAVPAAVGSAMTLANDSVTAAVLAADAITEIQNGLATPTNITAGVMTTVTNLTNLPAVTTDWLTAAGVKADAVTKIQNGLALTTHVQEVEDKVDTVDTVVDAIKVTVDANLDMKVSDVDPSVAISATEALSVATGVMEVSIYYTLNQTVTSTYAGDLSSATKVWFAIKDIGDTDANSIVFMEKTAGLTVVNKTTYATTGSGGLVISGTAGDWDIAVTVDEAATALLSSYANDYHEASLKALIGGNAVHIWDGECRITDGVIRTLA